jgi:hypothetical protein
MKGDRKDKVFLQKKKKNFYPGTKVHPRFVPNARN